MSLVDFKFGHPVVFQINNYVITVNTTKCVSTFLMVHHQGKHILYNTYTGIHKMTVFLELRFCLYTAMFSVFQYE
jgi:hypothetical protein